MERKITHYVVKPEHREHYDSLLAILKAYTPTLIGSDEFKPTSAIHALLINAKVLDLWCTPVYQKEKVTGWYTVTTSKGLIGPHPTKQGWMDYPLNTVGQIFIDQEIE